MKKENKKLKNIKKSSSVALIIAKIAKIICVIGIVLCVGAGIEFIRLNDALNTVMSQATLEKMMNEIIGNDFRMFFLDSHQVGIAMGVYFLIESVLLIILAVSFHYIGKIFQDIKVSDSPFRRPVLKNMKVVFVLITLLILQSAPLSGVMAGFSFWCVYSLFEYGCELQQLSDETL